MIDDVRTLEDPPGEPSLRRASEALRGDWPPKICVLLVAREDADNSAGLDAISGCVGLGTTGASAALVLREG